MLFWRLLCVPKGVAILKARALPPRRWFPYMLCGALEFSWCSPWDFLWRQAESFLLLLDPHLADPLLLAAETDVWPGYTPMVLLFV